MNIKTNDNFFKWISLKGNKLSDIIESSSFKKNNFDFIRFFAAFLVIFSHSFPLSYGNENNEPLKRLADNATFGLIGVYSFFLISGFLITISFEQSKSIKIFFIKRFLRIYPALIVVVILTALIYGPLMTEFSLFDYFTNPGTYKYLISSTTFRVIYQLPGVLNSNPYPGIVNGSLWTLKYEILCYILVGIMGFLNILKGRTVLYGTISSIIISSGINYLGLPKTGIIISIFNLSNFFIYFGIGMLFYFYRKIIVFNRHLLLISITLLMISIFTPLFQQAFSIFGAYILFYYAFTTTEHLSKFSQYGDFSYGMYIYAFPVQQFITGYFQEYQEWWFNTIISTPFILIFAILSWHLIEKRALALKKKIL